MTAELARVIRSKYDSEYSPELQFRPSMRCGSLVMQAVVGGDTIASQLREHYSSAGNELKLEVGGQPLLFAPPVTTTPSSTTKTTTAAAATTTKLRTATSNQPALIDEKRSNPDEDDEQYFVMGLSLTVTLGVVIALTSIVVICVTQCGSRANQYKSKDGAGGDEDAEVHVVSAENQEKVMSDDPYEVNVEMRTMVVTVASKINSNKEDEDVAEPEHEPESEPKAEAPTTEDSQKAAYETTVDINV